MSLTLKERSILSLNPLEVRDRLASSFNTEGVYVLDEQESYGCSYALLQVPQSIPWMLVCPLDTLYWAHLSASGTAYEAITHFRYVVARATIRQHKLAGAGQISCPTETMGEMLKQYKIFHCIGQWRETHFDWTKWAGENNPPSFPREPL